MDGTELEPMVLSSKSFLFQRFIGKAAALFLDEYFKRAVAAGRAERTAAKRGSEATQ
jgi:hypothetical protein